MTADREALQALSAALGVSLTEEQQAQLIAYLQLLQRWNATYNLTAVREPAAMFTQHLADCLAVIPPLQRMAPDGGRLLDVGSGGGLPGVVIACALPAWDVTCVDAVAKKAAFVRQAAGSLALSNLHAAHARVESLKEQPFQLITSRAFASLIDFVTWTRPHLAPGGAWMAMKGRVPDDEMAALPHWVDVFHVEHLAVPGLDAQRCLVWMRPKA